MKMLATFFSGLLLLTTVSHAQVVPAEVLGKLPAIYDISISPDGNKLAGFVNHNGVYSINLVRFDQNDVKPELVTLEKGLKPESIMWVNNDYVLASVWQSGRERGESYKQYATYKIEASSVFDHSGKLEAGLFTRRVVDYLKNDPDHILVSKPDKFGRSQVYKRSLKGGHKNPDVLIQKSERDVQRWITDQRGVPRIGEGIADGRKGTWNMKIRDADSDVWRNVSEYSGLRADMIVLGFTNNVNEVVVARYNDRDTLGAYIYDLLQKRYTKELFHHEQYDVSAVVSNSTGKIIGVEYVSDSVRRILFSGEDKFISQLEARFPEFTVNYLSQSSNGQRVLFSMTNPSNPGAVYLYDAANDKITRIAEQYPGLPIENLGRVISGNYKSRDGSTIEGFLTIPMSLTSNAEIKNLPFIVLPHGGPFSRDQKQFDYFAQFFASRGYAVFQMNFRGSTGYGKGFANAGREDWSVMMSDIEDATRTLISEGWANPDRICIAGWSFGGYAALMGAANDPDLYRCVISVAGLTDLRNTVNNLRETNTGKFFAKNFVQGGFDSKLDFKQGSPVNRADDIKAPVFLAHGEYDVQVQYDQFTKMEKALKKADVKFVAHNFKKEDHYFSTEKNRIKLLIEMDKFLETHLGQGITAAQ